MIDCASVVLVMMMMRIPSFLTWGLRQLGLYVLARTIRRMTLYVLRMIPRYVIRRK